MEGEGLANYIGTIDLNKRKVYHAPNGQIKTEHSFGFSPDNGNTEIVIPQIVNGTPVSQREAIDHFFRTGEHLGAFNKDDYTAGKKAAEVGFYDMVANYANKIHERQANYYKGR